MNPKSILCLALVLSGGWFGCATKPDAIDSLASELSASRGFWLNGFPAPQIALPKSAAVDELVVEAFKPVDFDPGHVTSHRILKSRWIQIALGLQKESYLAAWVETNLGKKIVSLHYDKTNGNWWRRIYNDPPTGRYY